MAHRNREEPTYENYPDHSNDGKVLLKNRIGPLYEEMRGNQNGLGEIRQRLKAAYKSYLSILKNILNTIRQYNRLFSPGVYAYEF